MSESLPPTQTTGEPLAYQPISGWALAGFATGALFTILVVSSTAVALVQGAPVFFPVGTLVVPMVGIVLSLLGQQHVRNSEGTRAGAKLATLGLWLSLISGLSYLSYYYVTGLAVQSQANAFLMEKGPDSGFFPRLLEGASKPPEINAAFLLTRPATQRSGRTDDETNMIELFDTSPKDGVPGELTQFREGPFPRLFFKHLAKDAVITPLTVQDWKYEVRSYKIYRNYRVQTKELETEVQMAVFSNEAETAGQDRKWFVNLRESYPLYKTMTFTPLGTGLRQLRYQSFLWLQQWAGALNDGRAYPEIKQTDQSDWSKVYVKEGNRAKIRALLHQTFAGSDRNRLRAFGVLPVRDDFGKWEPADGKIRIYHNFRFALEKEPGGPPLYNVDGYAILETKKAIDPTQFDPAAPPEWDVVHVVFTQITPALPERK